ncbi:hypothetical protein FNF29_04058 [Cafeteria roenbergensis]|uniref:Protein kinase domain-containing protein n=1 Tax=Cafeteria roenbergensis TaxID=33653 RepID=A0A5A8CGK5_CAFRO|nr:hypothetical protein FNF29_04058 [Cafeteria roenbergensis]|eukprot:KAA0152192.1 hypothetical protein FNF29_04058 [Cafeteria roenbergensis]
METREPQSEVPNVHHCGWVRSRSATSSGCTVRLRFAPALAVVMDTATKGEARFWATSVQQARAGRTPAPPELDALSAKIRRIHHTEVQLAPSPFVEGGAARVFRGTWEGRFVAVKELCDSPVKGPSTAAVVRESNVLASLEHANVARLLGVGWSPRKERPFMVMDLAAGTLLDWIHPTRIETMARSPSMWPSTPRRRITDPDPPRSPAAAAAAAAPAPATTATTTAPRAGAAAAPAASCERDDAADEFLRAWPRSAASLASVLHDVACGMQFVHEQGIVHCDLKPSNILLDEHSHARVCDFGLSQVAAHRTAARAQGTQQYMAPELLTTAPVVMDAAVDVFAFGVMAWEACTGKQAFAGVFAHDDMARGVRDGIRPPIPHAAPRALADLLESCWHGDPTMRPTFAEVARQLAEEVRLHGHGLAGALFPDDEVLNDIAGEAGEMDAVAPGVDRDRMADEAAAKWAAMKSDSQAGCLQALRAPCPLLPGLSGSQQSPSAEPATESSGQRSRMSSLSGAALPAMNSATSSGCTVRLRFAPALAVVMDTATKGEARFWATSVQQARAGRTPAPPELDALSAKVRRIHHTEVQLAPSPFVEGGAARVFRGTWEGRFVAVKELCDSPVKGPSTAAVVRESNVLASLEHANVARLLGVGWSPRKERPFMVMDLAAGTLLDWIHPTRIETMARSPSMWPSTPRRRITDPDPPRSPAAAAAAAAPAPVTTATTTAPRAGAAAAPAASCERDDAADEFLRAWPRSAASLASVLHDVACGMQFVHEQGIVHCDLKPSNILLDEHSHARVCDFGLSQVAAHRTAARAQGTQQYMAPELLTTAPVVMDAAVDVFAFGVMAWEACTGKQAFAGVFAHDDMARGVRDGIRPPIPHAAPRALADLLESCWHGDPTMRPTFAEVARQLAEEVRLHGHGLAGALFPDDEVLNDIAGEAGEMDAVAPGVDRDRMADEAAAKLDGQ